MHGIYAAGLEVRQEEDGSATLSGRFPYNSTATVSDGGRRGRPRKERFKPRAFQHRVEDPDAEIHLLAGHDFNRPMASKLSESLELEDSDDALTFQAKIKPEVAQTQHVRDTLALISAGLAVGISPGFRIPPERAVEDAEEIVEEEDAPEEGKHRAEIREIKAALLYELSVVTRPSYEESEVKVESRSKQPVRRAAAWRWRA